jgi:hypothetical protein
MPFELLDSISLPGNPPKQNEDAFGFMANAAVVLDGATAVTDPLMPGESDPAWLATFGARRLLAHLREGKSPEAAVRDTMQDADHSFRALRRREPAETYEYPFASMMLVVEENDGVETLSFGDCTALVQRAGEKLQIIGRAFQARANEACGVAQLAKAKGVAPASGFDRPAFLPSLRHARNRINGEKGPWLFGPDARAADHVAVKHVAAPAGTLVLLASDGFLALASDYSRYDADGLLATALTKGLKALGEDLRAVEEGDPEGRKFPRFKKSDDATAVLVRVS